MPTIRAAGTPTGATASLAAINPAVPAGWVNGDFSVMHVGLKPNTANVTTPAGWLLLGTWQNTGGTPGVDTGPTRSYLFYRFDQPVAPGNLNFGGGASCAGAVINIWAPDTKGLRWNLANTGVSVDDVQSSNYNASGSVDLGLAAGDVLIGCEVFSSDGGTITVESVTATGVTFGALTVRNERAISTGNDMRLRVIDLPVTAGPSSAGPAHGYTNLQGGVGHTSWLRLRNESVPASAFPRPQARPYYATQRAAVR